MQKNNTSKKLFHVLTIGIFWMAVEGINSPSQGMTPPKCSELMAHCKDNGCKAYSFNHDAFGKCSRSTDPKDACFQGCQELAKFAKHCDGPCM